MRKIIGWSILGFLFICLCMTGLIFLPWYISLGLVASFILAGLFITACNLLGL